MNKVYTTDRLILKTIDSTDADAVLAFFSDNKEEFDQWEPDKFSNFYTVPYQIVTLSYETSQINAKKMLRLWLFEKAAPEKIIGTISLTNILYGYNSSCVLGYKLDSQYRSKGYMYEALKELINIAFYEYELYRISANVMPNNHRSIHLLEKLDFTKEGTARGLYKIQNSFENHYVYSLIKSDLK